MFSKSVNNLKKEEEQSFIDLQPVQFSPIPHFELQPLALPLIMDTSVHKRQPLLNQQYPKYNQQFICQLNKERILNEINIKLENNIHQHQKQSSQALNVLLQAVYNFLENNDKSDKDYLEFEGSLQPHLKLSLNPKAISLEGEQLLKNGKFLLAYIELITLKEVNPFLKNYLFANYKDKYQIDLFIKEFDTKFSQIKLQYAKYLSELTQMQKQQQLQFNDSMIPQTSPKSPNKQKNQCSLLNEKEKQFVHKQTQTEKIISKYVLKRQISIMVNNIVDKKQIKLELQSNLNQINVKPDEQNINPNQKQKNNQISRSKPNRQKKIPKSKKKTQPKNSRVSTRTKSKLKQKSNEKSTEKVQSQVSNTKVLRSSKIIIPPIVQKKKSLQKKKRQRKPKVKNIQK